MIKYVDATVPGQQRSLYDSLTSSTLLILGDFLEVGLVHIFLGLQ